VFISLPSIGIGSAVLREGRQLYDLASSKSAAGGGWAEWIANLLHRSTSLAGVESPETEEHIRTALIDRLQAFGGTALALGP